MRIICFNTDTRAHVCLILVLVRICFLSFLIRMTAVFSCWARIYEKPHGITIKIRNLIQFVFCRHAFVIRFIVIFHVKLRSITTIACSFQIFIASFFLLIHTFLIYAHSRLSISNTFACSLDTKPKKNTQSSFFSSLCRDTRFVNMVILAYCCYSFFCSSYAANVEFVYSWDQSEWKIAVAQQNYTKKNDRQRKPLDKSKKTHYKTKRTII